MPKPPFTQGSLFNRHVLYHCTIFVNTNTRIRYISFELYRILEKLSPLENRSSNIIVQLLGFAEFFFAYSAEGALEILGQILEFRSGSDSVFGISLSLVVFPAANLTYVFFHFILPYLSLFSICFCLRIYYIIVFCFYL